MAELEARPGSKARPPKVRRRKWLGWAVVLAAAVGGYFWYSQANKAGQGGTMITAKVTRGDLIETVTATGSIVAQTGAEVHIGSQITGVIKALRADVGQMVKANSIIAELDLPDLRAQLAQAQAGYASAQTKVAQAETTLAQTRLQVDSSLRQARATVDSMRHKVAFAEANASQVKETVPTDVQRAENGLQSAIAALNTANATLKQTQSGAALNVAVAQAALNQATANAAKSDADLARNQQLYDKQFLSASDLDSAIATAKVNRAAVHSAGQTLLLTRQKVESDLEASRDAVTQANQNVESARSTVKSALSEHFSISAQAANAGDAQASLAEAEASLAIAEANLRSVDLRTQDVATSRDAARQAAQLVAFNQAQLNKSIIRTPISGTVLNLSVQQGETLAAGLSAPTVIVVADLSRLEVDAYVDETDIGKVKLGQRVQVSVDAFPQQTFRGSVFKIASGSTIQQGVVTYDVSVKLESQSHLLKPDMTATVTIETGSQRNVLLVQSVAVHTGVKDSRVNVLKTVAGKQTVESVVVQTGGTDGLNTEIKSGLTEGETIVVAGTNLPGQQQRRGPMNPFGASGGKKGG